MAEILNQVVNSDNLQKTIARCKERSILIPTFAQMKSPDTIPQSIQEKLPSVGMQEINPLNLFRINWRNDSETGKIGGINFLVLPPELTGIAATIIGLTGKHFPTGAHKVGASFGCLVPYMVTGRFNPDYHKAVWPSTGNYCRGGAFNSALLGVHAVAILPEEMSKERFDWLREIGAEVHATYGCESNVKEIYDKCHELEAQSGQYLIFNQFDQFGNAVWHHEVTGPTLEEVYRQLSGADFRVRGYVSATGSAGTIAAGDYLKKVFPTMKIVASEALQCPTLLNNGYGAHRIEGIGDKHVPWIHNTKNTDAVAAVNDEHPLRVLRVFNEPAGQEFLAANGIASGLIQQLPQMGISSIANMLSAIKFAKYFELAKNDIVFTVFTDSVDMYRSRLEELSAEHGHYTKQQAEIDYTAFLLNQSYDNFKELAYTDKKAIHNLKYFTWVEQQGKDVNDLNAQWYDDAYWEKHYALAPVWDSLIGEFNASTGVTI